MGSLLHKCRERISENEKGMEKEHKRQQNRDHMLGRRGACISDELDSVKHTTSDSTGDEKRVRMRLLSTACADTVAQDGAEHRPGVKRYRFATTYTSRSPQPSVKLQQMS